VLVLLALAAVSVAPAQKQVTWEGNPGLEFSNDKVALVMLPNGGAFVSLTLKGAKSTGPVANPMWDPIRMAREAGARQSFGRSQGHFLCVDGFGPVSKQEAAAGLTSHGEANKLPWEVVTSTATAGTFRVALPKVHETLTRSVRLTPGEPVVLVESEIESHLPFDRPMLWAEHATIGAPFLALGKTVVDASSTQCRTKPYQAKGNRTFASGEDFQWPKLHSEDLRQTPSATGTLNHIGCLMDPSREVQFITAFNTETRLMIGYLFPREDYPWVQHWMNYPANGAISWGLEFGMQPYDMTKQDILALSPMFGKPTFRWLPAQSKVKAKFLMFLAEVPQGFRHAEDVRIERGRIVVEDKTSGQKVTLPFSGSLP
jgi:hypothetical protein